MKFILALDQSTSASKAMLFDLQGHLLDKESLLHEQIYPRPGWVEHDAEEIYQNVVEVVRKLLARHQDKMQDLLCLSITNQRETILVFDRETGKPIHHAIVWQCRRGSEICTKLTEAGNNELVQEKTGLPIDTYFSASKIKWLIENEVDVATKLSTGEALIGTIESYLIYRLTNGNVFASDHTNACRTLLFNIAESEWDQELCNVFNVPIEALPEIRESSAQFGVTNVEGILTESLPICGVMGDSQAALFAQRCYTPGSAKITLGSGSSVMLNVGESMVRSDSGIVTTMAWTYAGTPTYAVEGIINFTGATIAWMKDQMGLIENVDETEQLALSVKDNGGVYLVPGFVGLSAPYWEPDAKAAILGMTPHSTKAHIVRAALESIAYRVKDVLSLMVKDAGVEMQFINADGGAVKNHFLMQFMADILGITVRASSLPELSALGAVFSGLLGMRVVNGLEDLQALSMKSVDYEPLMDSLTADKFYKGWLDAVQRTLH